MADQTIKATEEMVGSGHATKSDTLNRLTLVEHNTDGTHKAIPSPGAIGETAGNTIRGLNKEIVMAATDSLDANECAGTLINNYGQTDDAVISLPAAAAGMSFVIVLGTTVAKYYRLDPNASDSIFLDGTTTGDGKYVGIASAAKGAVISFIAFQTGASSYDWYAAKVNGTWVAEAA